VWVAAHRDTKQKLYYYEKTSNQKINHRKKFAKKWKKVETLKMKNLE